MVVVGVLAAVVAAPYAYMVGPKTRRFGSCAGGYADYFWVEMVVAPISPTTKCAGSPRVGC